MVMSSITTITEKLLTRFLYNLKFSFNFFEQKQKKGFFLNSFFSTVNVIQKVPNRSNFFSTHI